MGRWTAVAILAAAQFVMVLDSSVMNVSISNIVDDLDTTIQGVQGAITLYTLVMAAFMLVGAKLGDIWGRDRAFAIGLAVYGAGSFITAISPSLPVLLFGWSIVEGLGAVLVIPSIAALIAANYEGRERALAYALIGGVAASAIAAGPLIGGWVTEMYTWRLVFLGEVVVVVAILLVRKRMRPAPRAETPPRLDLVGAAISATGLALIVFGILMSSTWGWIAPKSPPVIGGREIAPLGFSPVPFLILGGLGLLALLSTWIERQNRLGRDALVDLSMLKIPRMRAGLTTLGAQQLVLLGTFFVLPVYLQVVLGYGAFDTGLKLFPLSVAMLISALLGPRMAARRSPKRVAQVGLLALVVGAVVMLATLDVELNDTGFMISMVVFGVGAGLLASQLGNVILSSVGPERSSEAGGLQGTAQNLGASLGTALIGAILLSGLASAFASNLAENPDISADTRAALTATVEAGGIAILPADEGEALLIEAGVPPDEAAEIADDYLAAQLEGLRLALGAVAALAFLSLWFTRRLPDRSTAAEAAPAEASTASPA